MKLPDMVRVHWWKFVILTNAASVLWRWWAANDKTQKDQAQSTLSKRVPRVLKQQLPNVLKMKKKPKWPEYYQYKKSTANKQHNSNSNKLCASIWKSTTTTGTWCEQWQVETKHQFSLNANTSTAKNPWLDNHAECTVLNDPVDCCQQINWLTDGLII